MSDRAPRLGVSACLFRAGAVLLVERGAGPYRGLLSLPGGGVEWGERLADAARREVAEETGLSVARLGFHAVHEAIDPAGTFHAVIAVFRAEGDIPRDAEPRAGDDARAAAFHPLPALAALEAAGRLTPGLRAVVEGAFANAALACG